jgi:RNA polymerase sigma factor (sigma-70 family)
MASVRLCVSQQHLRTLFHEGAVGALTDGELLERFASRRGEAAEAAFAVLVERHAPMVLATCRQLLDDLHDAEDASQAAFLVLARKARTIRSGQAVGGWLHAVAVRIASKAKVAAARRRKHEQRGVEMATPRAEAPDPADRWTELHHQIDRLPDRLRMPIVLCYLEGLTHAEAARQLGWPLGTVESRLARGRERLKQRLSARGAMATVLLLGDSLPEITPSTAPAAWVRATARAATRFAAGDAAAVVASANVATMARAMIWTMGFHQVKLVVMALSLVTLVATGAAAFIRSESPERSASARPDDRRSVTPSAEKPGPPPAPVPNTIRLGGRVLDPDGRPLPGAKLWLGFQGADWTWSTRVPQVRAATGPEGRFDLAVSDDDAEVKRALRMTSGMPGGFGAIQLVATAEGFGPVWIDIVKAKGEVELRMVRDDVPIEGRLTTLEGRPVRGAEVRTLLVEDPRNTEWLFGAPSGYLQAAITDGDGRFRLAGIGRDRRAVLKIAGPGIQRDGLQVVTGSFPKDRKPIYNAYAVYPAKLEHPCKPGKTISGVVRDIDTRAPLPGVSVSGFNAHDTSDREGRFRLEGLPNLSSFHLSASARGGDQPYITTRRSVQANSDFEPITADMDMVRGVVVTGRLIDRADGKPVQAWVSYCALRDNPHLSRLPLFESRTDGHLPMPNYPSQADGRFRLVVPPGRGFLVAYIQYQPDRYIPAGIPSKRHSGASADALDLQYDTTPFELFPQNFPAVRPIDVAPGIHSLSCDLTFDSGVTRTGTVLDPDGHPLSGVSMIGEFFRDTWQFRALEDPQFTVYGLSPSPLLPRTLIFRHAGRGLGKAWRVVGKEQGPLQVRLEPTASVTGRLLEAPGRPREGALVRVWRDSHEPTRRIRQPFEPPIQATSGPDGRFRIDGIVPGEVQTLQAIGWIDQAEVPILEDWTPKPGELKDLGEILRGGKG